ncbi:MAG TPA: hypothetical protein PKW94_00810 [Candidatus Dojkabacteria bacterium]|jgi:hypothetical protein|nr:hypothetical protein [Candidatus Dojkabacteria bacterium]HOR05827.1 hypothetical protein [Candidatus Dojkabacteria bacterium]HOT60829.1 hypothetical protein [Candidatus Dojkabacteria bacterium]HQI92806.1 hypothetical protein [Candidatus Dojkabacteria bacterium]
MPNLYDEYIKAVSKNIILNGLNPADRLDLYCLLVAKDYAGVYSFLRKKIPDLYERISANIKTVFLEE